MGLYISPLGGLLIMLLLGITAHAQPIPKAITNVRVEVDSERVKIQYDVVGITAVDSIYVEVESRSAGALPLSTVTGDIGKGVSTGINRTIYWDYRLDNVRIDSDIRATILVKQPATATLRKTYSRGGPTNALLSALMPGLGTIFVQPNRKIGARPLITAAYGGLLVYGLVQRGRSQKQYAVYETQRIDSDYQEANRLHHHYLLAVRAAAAVWLTDVIYTFLKGRKNEKQRSITAQRVLVDYVAGTSTVGIQFSF